MHAKQALEAAQRLWPDFDYMEQVGGEHYLVTLTSGEVHYMGPQGHRACGPRCRCADTPGKRPAEKSAQTRREARREAASIPPAPQWPAASETRQRRSPALCGETGTDQERGGAPILQEGVMP